MITHPSVAGAAVLAGLIVAGGSYAARHDVGLGSGLPASADGPHPARAASSRLGRPAPSPAAPAWPGTRPMSPRSTSAPPARRPRSRPPSRRPPVAAPRGRGAAPRHHLGARSPARARSAATTEAEMTNTALRVYTTVIALICGGAVAWSIHQSSITTAWQADARSWHSLAAQAVAHDRLTTRSMHQIVARYDRLIVRTRAARSASSSSASGRRSGPEPRPRRERPDHLLQHVPRLGAGVGVGPGPGRRRAGARPRPPTRARPRDEHAHGDHDRCLGVEGDRHHLADPPQRAASPMPSPRPSPPRSSTTRRAGRGSAARAR